MIKGTYKALEVLENAKVTVASESPKKDEVAAEVESKSDAKAEGKKEVKP